MCGIFGFISSKGGGPDLAILRRIAVETQSRGRHAFGMAWLGAEGPIETFKRPGAADDDLRDVDRCEGARIVIGHCRYATHGSPSDNRNNHPHVAGRGWFVHNGVVHNHQTLAWLHDLVPTTACDTEILGLLIARFRGPLGLRAARAAEAAEGELAILGIWRKPARLLIVRNGKPLCYGRTADGYYFASLDRELPGRVRHVPDEQVSVATFASGLSEVSYPIRPLLEPGAAL
jgi:glucosamine 6-phosphate synthetase-like amidotransferase/phosphosugar isomerase protein